MQVMQGAGAGAGEVVVVRRARAGDAAARAQLLREALLSLTTDAFCYFFFHEATLQGTVLAGAALFIFMGAGLGALLALPGAALLVLAGARAALAAAAARAAARLPRERAGWVAERRGPPRPPGAAPPPRLPVLHEDKLACDQPVLLTTPQYTQIVGTVSVWACRDAAGGWLGALAVAAAWRRRGAARALEAAARRGAAQAGYPALHALTSALTPAARALLHEAGWQMSGGYARPLLGAALSLPLARLQCDLADCA